MWIGPQQQQEPGVPLGEKCALDYPLQKHCPTQGCVTMRNITLRNVRIERPLLSPGVILGNASNPIGLAFENVTVDGEAVAWETTVTKTDCSQDLQVTTAGDVATLTWSPL